MDLTGDLIEAVGIFVGDGYLRYHGNRKELDISGSYNEKGYYDNHVIPLFEKIFSIKIIGRYFPSRKTYGFVIRKKEIINVFKELGFPSGSKGTTVHLYPKIFTYCKKNPYAAARFLRGYFDTDGCLTFMKKNQKRYHHYPRLIFTSISQELIKQTKELIKIFGIGFYGSIREFPNKGEWNTQHRIFVCGKEKLLCFMKNIGSKNPTKNSRYLIWKIYGFCPTNITFDQRINIIHGKLDIHSFYVGFVTSKN